MLLTLGLSAVHVAKAKVRPELFLLPEEWNTNAAPRSWLGRAVVLAQDLLLFGFQHARQRCQHRQVNANGVIGANLIASTLVHKFVLLTKNAF